MQGTGSGFIISERRILTNAHNIANQNWILVQRHGIPKKYPAKVPRESERRHGIHKKYPAKVPSESERRHGIPKKYPAKVPRERERERERRHGIPRK